MVCRPTLAAGAAAAAAACQQAVAPSAGRAGAAEAEAAAACGSRPALPALQAWLPAAQRQQPQSAAPPRAHRTKAGPLSKALQGLWTAVAAQVLPAALQAARGARAVEGA